tara:strand:- start:460 stop:573 length:114 start_codon:yes stop_codon:yes gene_type:complete
MIAINKKTGLDVTSFLLKYMKGELTKEEFEELTGLKK